MSVRIAVILEQKGSDVVTVPPEASIAEAAAMLAEHNIGALVVSSDGETVEGVVSERDIVRHVAQRRATMRIPVAEVMTRDVTTCPPTATTDDLVRTMTTGRIRHIPVTDEGRLVGIVSIGDVVRRRMDELEVEADSLQDYVSGGY